MKLVAGLGNPGPAYEGNRHNVGWWVVDRLACDWGFGGFRAGGRALVSRGVVEGARVLLLKPTTYMNLSGAAIRPLVERECLDVSSDLLVVVDDAALPLGRVRFRAKGSAGSHNGLASVAAVLGTTEYPRLRLGVGVPPDGVRLRDWVLSDMGAEDEDEIVALLPSLTGAIALWVREGIEGAMNQFNR